MDKLSLRILKHIASQQDDIPTTSVIDLFGDASKKSLSFLEKEGFIKSGRTILGIGADMKPVFTSNGIYSISSKGLAFIEEKPGRDFDHWLTRVCAIWGAVTGTAAIVIEIVLHFL